MMTNNSKKLKKDIKFAKEIKVFEDSPEKKGARAVIDFIESAFVTGHDDFYEHYCIKKEDWETLKLLLK